MDVKGISTEGAGENDILLEIAGKAVLVNIVGLSFGGINVNIPVELCPMFIWKAEFASDELR